MWNAEQNTWFARPDGDPQDYVYVRDPNHTPQQHKEALAAHRAFLVTQKDTPAATKALYNYLHYGQTDQIYPNPAQYRVWIFGPGQPPVNLRLDPRLAEVADRPAKMRQFGVKAERAAWTWLCDTL